MPWLTDEEVADLKKQRPTTGNDFIDAYQLGYDAGCASRNAEVREIERTRSDYFFKIGALEAERNELAEENAELKKKIKKLKKGGR